MNRFFQRCALIGLLLVASAAAGAAEYADVIIRGGTVYDGSGKPGRVADVAIKGDRIIAIGNLRGRRATQQRSMPRDSP